MITALELTRFTEKNGWVVEDKGENFIRYLTPQGRLVLVRFYEDGSIQSIID